MNMTAEKSGRSGRTGRGCGNVFAADTSAFLALFCNLLRLFGAQLPRKLIVSAVAAGLILMPLPAAFGHEGVEILAQTELDGAEHGHSHDDGETEHSSASHGHGGHDPADHSHQFALLAGAALDAVMPLPKGWSPLAHGRPDQAADFGIDRPPKRMMSL
jgi:hypothetical protein